MGENIDVKEPHDNSIRVDNVKYYPKDVQMHTVNGRKLPYPIHGFRVCGKCAKVIPVLKYADHYAVCLGDAE